MGLFSFSSLSPINFLLTKKEKIITPEVKTFQDVPFGNLTKVKGGLILLIQKDKKIIQLKIIILIQQATHRL